MSKFFPTSGFKWIDPREFDSNKYISNISKGCVLEVGLKYPKELCHLHNDCLLATDKTEVKNMLSSYQLKIVDFFTFSIGTVKNW